MTEETSEEKELKENPEVLTEEEKAAALKAEEGEETEEGEDASTGTKEEEKEEEKAEEKKDEDFTNEEQLRIELSDLKSRNMSLDQTVRKMETQLKKYGDVLKEANMLEELDEDQQKEHDKAILGRKIFLDQMWETMSLNPKYEDIDQVVTSHNKQLVISAYAEQLVSDDPSIEMPTAEIAVKQSIDELTNPHKFYYEQIKIIEKGDTEEDKEKEKNKDVKSKPPELKDAPGSVNNMGGGSKGDGGWTMKKLDEMDEEDMIKANIPDDILEKWKSGTLPK